MTTAKRNYVRILVECAIMLALSFALSFIGFEMPMGGKVTPASMLPLFLVAIHLGVGSTLITTALYSLLQIWQAYLAGNVFVYCQDGATLALCVIFDYVLPFTLPFIITVLFAKLWKINDREGFIYVGMILGLVVRFVSHFISGVLIWGQWAEDMSPALYSFLYNGTFMLPELIITVAVAFFLLRHREIRRIVRS
ncbi:MAG: energy-coupled thiamine transporter ThiT [Clostridia bacterium]|nr:energy-coupled thiamine transporter ThiT [Clostridia bacterium]